MFFKKKDVFVFPSAEKDICYLSLSCTGFFTSFFFFFFLSFSSSSSSSSSDSEPSSLSSLSDPDPLSSLPLPLSELLAESDSEGERGRRGWAAQLIIHRKQQHEGLLCNQPWKVCTSKVSTGASSKQTLYT